MQICLCNFILVYFSVPQDGFLLGCWFAISDYPEQMADKQLLATWKRVSHTIKRKDKSLSYVNNITCLIFCEALTACIIFVVKYCEWHFLYERGFTNKEYCCCYSHSDIIIFNKNMMIFYKTFCHHFYSIFKHTDSGAARPTPKVFILCTFQPQHLNHCITCQLF